MKTIVITSALAALVFVACVLLFAPVRTHREKADDRPVSVSLVRLIAAPELFDGKKVSVSGYVVIEFEGTAVYLHKEDADRGLLKNAIFLGFGTEGPRSVTRNIDACPGYAHIEGTFRATKKDEYSPWSGALVGISVVEFYPKEKEPNQSLQPTAAAGRG